jgi:hypothetical protein
LGKTKQLNPYQRGRMTEKDKERVRETLWALTDEEAKYLHKYLQEAKLTTRYRFGKEPVLKRWIEGSFIFP